MRGSVARFATAFKIPSRVASLFRRRTAWTRSNDSLSHASTSLQSLTHPLRLWTCKYSSMAISKANTLGPKLYGGDWAEKIHVKREAENTHFGVVSTSGKWGAFEAWLAIKSNFSSWLELRSENWTEAIESGGRATLKVCRDEMCIYREPCIINFLLIFSAFHSLGTYLGSKNNDFSDECVHSSDFYLDMTAGIIDIGSASGGLNGIQVLCSQEFESRFREQRLVVSERSWRHSLTIYLEAPVVFLGAKDALEAIVLILTWYDALVAPSA